MASYATSGPSMGHTDASGGTPVTVCAKLTPGAVPGPGGKPTITSSRDRVVMNSTVGSFTFSSSVDLDSVFNEAEPMTEVSREVTLPLVSSMLEGVNSCLLVAGNSDQALRQVVESSSTSVGLPGFLFHQIWDQLMHKRNVLAASGAEMDASLFFSALALHGQAVFDLTHGKDPASRSCAVIDSEWDGPVADGALMVGPIASVTDIDELLDVAQASWQALTTEQEVGADGRLLSMRGGSAADGGGGGGMTRKGGRRKKRHANTSVFGDDDGDNNDRESFLPGGGRGNRSRRSGNTGPSGRPTTSATTSSDAQVFHGDMMDSAPYDHPNDRDAPPATRPASSIGLGDGEEDDDDDEDEDEDEDEEEDEDGPAAGLRGHLKPKLPFSPNADGDEDETSYLPGEEHYGGTGGGKNKKLRRRRKNRDDDDEDDGGLLAEALGAAAGGGLSHHLPTKRPRICDPAVTVRLFRFVLDQTIAPPPPLSHTIARSPPQHLRSVFLLVEARGLHNMQQQQQAQRHQLHHGPGASATAGPETTAGGTGTAGELNSTALQTVVRYLHATAQLRQLESLQSADPHSLWLATSGAATAGGSFPHSHPHPHPPPSAGGAGAGSPEDRGGYLGRTTTETLAGASLLRGSSSGSFSASSPSRNALVPSAGGGSGGGAAAAGGFDFTGVPQSVAAADIAARIATVKEALEDSKELLLNLADGELSTSWVPLHVSPLTHLLEEALTGAFVTSSLLVLANSGVPSDSTLALLDFGAMLRALRTYPLVLTATVRSLLASHRMQLLTMRKSFEKSVSEATAAAANAAAEAAAFNNTANWLADRPSSSASSTAHQPQQLQNGPNGNAYAMQAYDSNNNNSDQYRRGSASGLNSDNGSASASSYVVNGYGQQQPLPQQQQREPFLPPLGNSGPSKNDARGKLATLKSRMSNNNLRASSAGSGSGSGAGGGGLGPSGSFADDPLPDFPSMASNYSGGGGGPSSYHPHPPAHHPQHQQQQQPHHAHFGPDSSNSYYPPPHHHSNHHHQQQPSSNGSDDLALKYEEEMLHLSSQLLEAEVENARLRESLDGNTQGLLDSLDSALKRAKKASAAAKAAEEKVDTLSADNEDMRTEMEAIRNTLRNRSTEAQMAKEKVTSLTAQIGMLEAQVRDLATRLGATSASKGTSEAVLRQQVLDLFSVALALRGRVAELTPDADEYARFSRLEGVSVEDVLREPPGGDIPGPGKPAVSNVFKGSIKSVVASGASTSGSANPSATAANPGSVLTLKRNNNGGAKGGGSSLISDAATAVISGDNIPYGELYRRLETATAQNLRMRETLQAAGAHMRELRDKLAQAENALKEQGAAASVQNAMALHAKLTKAEETIAAYRGHLSKARDALMAARAAAMAAESAAMAPADSVTTKLLEETRAQLLLLQERNGRLALETDHLRTALVNASGALHVDANDQTLENRYRAAQQRIAALLVENSKIKQQLDAADSKVQYVTRSFERKIRALLRQYEAEMGARRAGVIPPPGQGAADMFGPDHGPGGKLGAAARKAAEEKAAAAAEKSKAAASRSKLTGTYMAKSPNGGPTVGGGGVMLPIGAVKEVDAPRADGK